MTNTEYNNILKDILISYRQRFGDGNALFNMLRKMEENINAKIDLSSISKDELKEMINIFNKRKELLNQIDNQKETINELSEDNAETRLSRMCVEELQRRIQNKIDEALK